MVRNFSLSLMTIITLVLLLLSVNLLLAVRVLTGEAIAVVKQQIDVSVYFKPLATEVQINEVRAFVDAYPNVVQTTYLNKEQSLARFREIYQGNSEVLKSIEELGDNPLGATLVVRTRDTQDYAPLMTALSVPEYAKIIDNKTSGDTQNAINKIQQVTTHIERFTFGITILFGLIAIIIIFNTVRVAIYTQRVEISIKKLVGASNWYVRGPFVVSSLLFSGFALLTTYGFICLVIHYTEPYVTALFNREAILSSYVAAHLWSLTVLQLVAISVLTVGTSYVAMRRYLKV